jgi:hypothetical protein
MCTGVRTLPRNSGKVIQVARAAGAKDQVVLRIDLARQLSHPSAKRAPGVWQLYLKIGQRLKELSGRESLNVPSQVRLAGIFHQGVDLPIV